MKMVVAFSGTVKKNLGQNRAGRNLSAQLLDDLWAGEASEEPLGNLVWRDVAENQGQRTSFSRQIKRSQKENVCNWTWLREQFAQILVWSPARAQNFQIQLTFSIYSTAMSKDTFRKSSRVFPFPFRYSFSNSDVS